MGEEGGGERYNLRRRGGDGKSESDGEGVRNVKMLDSWKKGKLVDECKRLGLSFSGTADVLKGRIRDSLGLTAEDGSAAGKEVVAKSKERPQDPSESEDGFVAEEDETLDEGAGVADDDIRAVTRASARKKRSVVTEDDVGAERPVPEYCDVKQVSRATAKAKFPKQTDCGSPAPVPGLDASDCARISTRSALRNCLPDDADPEKPTASAVSYAEDDVRAVPAFSIRNEELEDDKHDVLPQASVANLDDNDGPTIPSAAQQRRPENTNQNAPFAIVTSDVAPGVENSVQAGSELAHPGEAGLKNAEEDVLLTTMASDPGDDHEAENLIAMSGSDHIEEDDDAPALEMQSHIYHEEDSVGCNARQSSLPKIGPYDSKGNLTSPRQAFNGVEKVCANDVLATLSPPPERHLDKTRTTPITLPAIPAADTTRDERSDSVNSDEMRDHRASDELFHVPDRVHPDRPGSEQEMADSAGSASLDSRVNRPERILIDTEDTTGVNNAARTLQSPEMDESGKEPAEKPTELMYDHVGQERAAKWQLGTNPVKAQREMSGLDTKNENVGASPLRPSDANDHVMRMSLALKESPETAFHGEDYDHVEHAGASTANENPQSVINEIVPVGNVSNGEVVTGENRGRAEAESDGDGKEVAADKPDVDLSRHCDRNGDASPSHVHENDDENTVKHLPDSADIAVSDSKHDAEGAIQSGFSHRLALISETGTVENHPPTASPFFNMDIVHVANASVADADGVSAFPDASFLRDGNQEVSVEPIVRVATGEAVLGNSKETRAVERSDTLRPKAEEADMLERCIPERTLAGEELTIDQVGNVGCYRSGGTGSHSPVGFVANADRVKVNTPGSPAHRADDGRNVDLSANCTDMIDCDDNDKDIPPNTDCGEGLSKPDASTADQKELLAPPGAAVNDKSGGDGMHANIEGTHLPMPFAQRTNAAGGISDGLETCVPDAGPLIEANSSVDVPHESADMVDGLMKDHSFSAEVDSETQQAASKCQRQDDACQFKNNVVNANPHEFKPTQVHSEFRKTADSPRCEGTDVPMLPLYPPGDSAAKPATIIGGPDTSSHLPSPESEPENDRSVDKSPACGWLSPAQVQYPPAVSGDVVAETCAPSSYFSESPLPSPRPAYDSIVEAGLPAASCSISSYGSKCHNLELGSVVPDSAPEEVTQGVKAPRRPSDEQHEDINEQVVFEKSPRASTLWRGASHVHRLAFNPEQSARESEGDGVAADAILSASLSPSPRNSSSESCLLTRRDDGVVRNGAETNDDVESGQLRSATASLSPSLNSRRCADDEAAAGMSPAPYADDTDEKDSYEEGDMSLSDGSTSSAAPHGEIVSAAKYSASTDEEEDPDDVIVSDVNGTNSNILGSSSRGSYEKAEVLETPRLESQRRLSLDTSNDEFDAGATRGPEVHVEVSHSTSAHANPILVNERNATIFQASQAPVAARESATAPGKPVSAPRPTIPRPGFANRAPVTDANQVPSDPVEELVHPDVLLGKEQPSVSLSDMHGQLSPALSHSGADRAPNSAAAVLVGTHVALSTLRQTSNELGSGHGAVASAAHVYRRPISNVGSMDHAGTRQHTYAPASQTWVLPRHLVAPPPSPSPLMPPPPPVFVPPTHTAGEASVPPSDGPAMAVSRNGTAVVAEPFLPHARPHGAQARLTTAGSPSSRPFKRRKTDEVLLPLREMPTPANTLLALNMDEQNRFSYNQFASHGSDFGIDPAMAPVAQTGANALLDRLARIERGERRASGKRPRLQGVVPLPSVNLSQTKPHHDEVYPGTELSAFHPGTESLGAKLVQSRRLPERRTHVRLVQVNRDWNPAKLAAQSTQRAAALAKRMAEWRLSQSQQSPFFSGRRRPFHPVSSSKANVETENAGGSNTGSGSKRKWRG